jgi:hypothetical protein
MFGEQDLQIDSIDRIEEQHAPEAGVVLEATSSS